MSAQEIIAELPRLKQEERRQIARLIFELETEAVAVEDCARRAADNFRLLDVLEADDAAVSPR